MVAVVTKCTTTAFPPTHESSPTRGVTAASSGAPIAMVADVVVTAAGSTASSTSESLEGCIVNTVDASTTTLGGGSRTRTTTVVRGTISTTTPEAFCGVYRKSSTLGSYQG